MEKIKEDKKEEKAGDILQVASEVKPVVIDENGQKILCENEKEAIFLSYLIRIWMKLNNSK
jgi:hypothetical protein